MKAKKRDTSITELDQKLLEYVSYGWTNPEIAEYVNMSLGNTCRYLTRLLEKTRTTNRASLVRWGFENNYLR